MKYYKLLDDQDTGYYSGYKWDISGKWMKVKGKLEMCGNGFHVMRAKDIIEWLECGFNLYEVEVVGERILGDTKICVSTVRVVRKVEKYNKESLLKTVIDPAVKRAKQDAAAAYAAYTTAAAYAAAADAAADRAVYAAAAYATYADADASWARSFLTDAWCTERNKQTRDLKKLLR